MAAPERRLRRWSPLPPDALRARLREAVEPFEAPFTLRFRVSGAGVISRSLEAPETTKPLFGLVTPDRLRLACTPRAADVNPFAPIIRAELRAEAEGTALDLVLRSHPMAPGLIGFFRVFAAALGLASALGATTRPDVAAVGVVFALLFLVVPPLRARWGFDRGCTAAIAALEAAVPLQVPPGGTG